MTYHRLLPLLGLVLLFNISFAQDQKDGRYYETLARKAYQEKHFAEFLDNMKLAAELRPNHPRLMYNLAVALALNNKPTEAITWLRKTAEMGLIFPANKDSDFDTIRTLPDFKNVLRKFEENRAPKIHSLQAFTVHEKDLIPESVAYDPVEKIFYLSSIYKRKILAIDRSGASKEFSNASDGLWSVMGMKVDAPRRLLWVCTTAHRQMSNFETEDEGKSSLLKYDLKTGKLLARYSPTDKSKPHWLGDLVVNDHGDVFATDSVTPAVYVLKNGETQLETFLEGDPFVSLQGLDFSRDQKHLFVADYSKGVFLIDLKTRVIQPIASDFTLLGIDGLYAFKDSLICIQNGVNPQRIIKLGLNRNLTRFERFETLEANNPVFDEPTLGVIVKDSFYFVANSQWSAVDEKGRLAPPEKLKDPTILKLKL